MTANELSAALRRCRGGFVVVALVSGLVNLLYLTGSFFMLQVYDRVLPSRSLPTLVGLLILALALYAAQGTRVSADVTSDLKTGVNYYTARVGLQPDELARLGGQLLMPSMPVEAYL